MYMYEHRTCLVVEDSLRYEKMHSGLLKNLLDICTSYIIKQIAVEL